jgi:hypothetical protein
LIRDKLLTITGDVDLYIGEKEFLSPGYYRWTVPLAVRRIHVACVGAGGELDSYSNGGGGGSLCWANDIEVVPGEELMIRIGQPGSDDYSTDTDTIIGRPDDSDPVNYPNRFSEKLLTAGGARGREAGVYDLHGQSGGGGNGGRGGSRAYYSGAYVYAGGGGGAGGYTGNGGSGNAGAPGENSGAGSAGDRRRNSSGVEYGTFPGGYGGGVGVKGKGATGAQLPPINDGAGRNGNPGSGGSGSSYGGGGSYERPAGSGAVRIIWGITYSYPDNADVSK